MGLETSLVAAGIRRVAGIDKAPLPVTESLAGEVLSIPVRPDLAEDELDTIVGVINKVAGA